MHRADDHKKRHLSPGVEPRMTDDRSNNSIGYWTDDQQRCLVFSATYRVQSGYEMKAQVNITTSRCHSTGYDVFYP